MCSKYNIVIGANACVQKNRVWPFHDGGQQQQPQVMPNHVTTTPTITKAVQIRHIIIIMTKRLTITHWLMVVKETVLLHKFWAKCDGDEDFLLIKLQLVCC